MTHIKSRTRILAFCLAVILIIGVLPMPEASASSIADGSTTCEVNPINERQFLLTTTAGKRLGAFAYRYTTNDSLSGTAYCIDHVLNMTHHTLTITGEYTASPATAGAFANGYPQHSLTTFLGRFPNESALNGLTENEYAYATQIAVWATLGQLGVAGTSFTAGSEFVAQPTGDVQQIRVFRAAQLILDSANEWDRIYHTGMYIRLEENELGGNISLPGDVTLELAADREQYGIRRDVIGGTAYFTREYIFASATSTYYSDYNIEVWADGAPDGTIFVDENGQELPRGSFQDHSTWCVPTVIQTTNINDNGFEYWGRAKLCIPAEAAPNSGEITVNAGAHVMQYQIYLAHNDVTTEQSYIIADPSQGTVTADAVLKWGGPQSETGSLRVTKVGGGGQPLEGAKFTLSGSDGSSVSGTTDANGSIYWTDLRPDVQYTLAETEPPAGYVVADPVNVTIQAAQDNFVTVRDESQKTLTVRKIDAQNGYSLHGAVIAFRQVDGSFYTTGTTDHAGVIQFDADALPLGSYEVYEITAPEGYELDPEKQTLDWNGRNDVTLTFRNVRKPTLVLYKCDTDNLRCLPGATFEVYRNGSLITTVTTNDNGVATVPNISEGHYTVKEIAAPAGYVLDPTEHGIYIDPYDPATTADPQITVTNSAKPHLKIRKIDAETQEPLSDTTFDVYRDSTLIGSYTTDARGEILLTDLQPGTYFVKETAVKAGYVLDDTPQQIEIRAGKEDYSLTFTNSRKPGLKIVKYDEQTMKPLSDTTFEVYRDAELIGTYTTDSKGEIWLTDLQPGTYFVKEIAVKPGYVVNSSPQEIEIEAGNQSYTLIFLNLLKPGIRMVKIDAETKKPLPNARFRVSLIGGTYSKEFVSDASGEIDLTGLEPGSYLCEELTAPEHYLIDGAQRTIRINAGENAQFVFTNSRKPSLTVMKYDANLDKRLPGATFRVAKIEDGSHYLDRITDVDGSFTIENLEPGVYSVMEMDAPTGYVLVKTEYHVELFPGKDAQLIVNNEKKPDLKIIKKDAETGEPIPGATFTIRKVDSSTLLTETTDANGEIILSEMEPGVYEITEKSVPDEYLPDPIPQKITLEPNKTGVVQFRDYQKPSLTIQKIDSATGKPVEGARFHVIYASNHTFTGEVNDLGDYISDADGIIHLDKLRDGWYRIEETAAPEGYRIQGTGVQECYIAAGTDKVLTFENVPLSTILIQKMDEETGKPLPGAWFRVKYLNAMTSMDGTTLGEYVTDENGKIEITDLDEGTYIVDEISAPAGYVLSEAGSRTVYLSGENQDFITITYGNQKMGSLLIVKKDALTGEPLSGVEFFVTDSDGQVVGNANGFFTTDYAGSILIPGLEPGKTIVAKETRTVSGYVLDDTPQTIKIKANETVILEFRNQPKGTLIVQKIDAATGESLTGAEFKITNADGKLTPDNEGLTSSNGIYRVDSNGQIVLEKLNPGVYVVTEVRAPEGYVLIAQPQTVAVEPGDTQTITFCNPPKGSLIINKLDSVTGEPLEGCVFKITYADGRVVDDGKLSSNGLYVTDHNGQIVIANVVGTLVVTEEKTISGYVIDPETRSQTVAVRSDDAQVLTFYNSPKGTLVIEKLDKVTGEPLSGAEFKITTASGELLAANEGFTSSNGIYTTDANGQIVLSKLNPATYIVTETKAPEGYELDPTSQTVVINTADTQTLRFYNEPLATLTIIKKDADTGELLAGAAFTVKDAAGMPIGEEKSYVTGDDGTVTLSGLTPNTAVVVSEDEPPRGYWNGSDLQTAYLKSGSLNTVTFENRKLGTLIIKKFVEGTNNQPLKGVAFRVTSGDGTDLGSDGGVYYTDAKGEIVLSDLQPDIMVKVREIKTVDGYVMDGTPQEIRIIGGQTQQLTFWNAPQQTLTIVKYEAGTTNPIEGAIFLVSDSSGAVLGTSNGEFTTDSNGRIVITGLEPGITVTAKEIRAADGFILDGTPQSIMIRAGEAQTLTFYNEHKGGLVIRKIDGVTGKTLEGAEFLITHIDGSYADDHEGQTSTVGLYYSDRNGEIRLTGLEPDTYVIRETRAPDGYVLNGREQSVRVNANDTQYLTFENVPLQTVIIRKYVDGTTTPLAGVTFLVTDSAGNPIGSTDGKHVTDEEGRIVLSGLTPGMTLLVRETKTVKGYALNGALRTVVVGMDAASQPAVSTASAAGAGNELIVYDEPLSTLVIKKYVEGTDNEPIPGVAFKVTDGNGGAVGNNDGVWYTDAQGEITIPDLEKGMVITVREVKTVNGYVLDGTPKQVQIKSSEVHELIFWNAKRGALTIRALDSTTMVPIEGVTFKITTATGEFVPDKDGRISSNGLYKTDEAGEIVLTGVTGTFVVTMTETVAGYTVHEATRSQTIVVDPMDTQQLTAYCDPLQTLLVRVYEKGTTNVLAGIVFKVTSGDGTVVGSSNGEYVTDRNGQFSISGLQPGVSITAYEVGSISGFALNPVPQSITIKEGEMQTLTFFNERKGNLIIKLKDRETGLLIPNAEFRITTINGTFVDDNEGRTSTQGLYKTDENGEISLMLLQPDTYRITQLSTDANHVMDSREESVRVDTNDTQTIEIKNSPLQSLVITKVADNTGKPLPGVTFLVTYANGMPVGGGSGEYTTDENGRIVITGIPAGTTIVAKEIRTVKGYALNPMPQIITVTGAFGQAYMAAANNSPSDEGSGAVSGGSGNGNGSNQLTFTDAQLNTLTIHKYEAGTEHQPLKGVEFKITDGTGAPIGNANGLFYTDESGDITIPNLEAGAVIIVRETKALDGYMLDNTPQTIEIRGSGEQNELTFWNSRKGSLLVRKLDSVTHEPIAGVEFSIVYADGRYVEAEGGKLNSNGIYLTDKNGEIRINAVNGVVIVTEEETVPGYTINEGERSKTVIVDESSTAVLTFYNTPAGGLLILKTDEDTGERIEGVQFEVRKLNGEIVGTYTTDRFGRIYLPSLESGWYAVTETKAAAGYKKDTAPKQVCVVDGQTAQLSLTNVQYSSIVIHKTDSKTGEGIYGVKFIVFDSARNPIEQIVTDQNGYAWTETELIAGKYYVQETEAAEGYVEDKEYKTIVIETGKNSLIEWLNTPITGQIQITKTSADYNNFNGWAAGTPIPDTVFEIYSKAGRLVDTIKTNKYGVAASKPLPLGRYSIIESQAASFYALDKTPIEVEIEFAGQIVKAAMTDKSLYTNVSITKRGYSEVMTGQTIRYDFSDIANNSSTALESFYWRDTLPTGAVRLDKIVTGTWNAQGNYKIVYKTNYSSEYRLLADNLTTAKNYVLDASPVALGLANGEAVTEFMAVFGIVPSGFRQVEAPKVYCTVLSTLAGGTQFTNVADAGGVYNEQWIMAVSRWVTTVYKPAEPVKPLPKTGY